MTQGASGRDEWVDYAKAIGILLVVYGHVARGLSNGGIPLDTALYLRVDSLLYSFHMPLFFFLSGLYFLRSLRRRGRLGLAWNKVDTILYPYLLWSLLQGGVEVALSRYTNGHTTLAEVFTLWEPRVQFWFLYGLFLVVMSAILLYRGEGRTWLLGLLALAAAAHLWQASIPSVFHSHYVVKNLVFFALGVWFSTVSAPMARNPFPWAAAGVAAFLAGQYLFHGVLGLVYSGLGLPSLLLAVVSILSLASLCMALAYRPHPWMLALGEASMAIYVMHILTGSGARILLSRGLGIQDAATHLIVGCLAGVLLPLLVLRLSQRFGVRGLFEAPARLSTEGWWRRRATGRGG